MLWGIVLGWFLMFAVRRYRVHWGAFASFIAVVAGSGLLSFLFKSDLLGYYFIGVFAGFFGNVVLRAVGTAVGGKGGEALLDISALERRKE